MDITRAARLAETKLASALPRRWRHVQAVAAAAEKSVAVVPGDESVLVTAAWLHDIGYSPELVDTGFHPLDGARYLQKLGIDWPVCILVAHHSGALVEAKLRGLGGVLSDEFVFAESALSDALWYCDLTTGPDGQRLSVEERISEIRSRYGAGHLVTAFVQEAEPILVAAVRRTERRLAEKGTPQPI